VNSGSSDRDPVLEALWKKTLENWDDDAAHRAFIDYCQEQDRLVEAAVRYRGMKGDHERGPSAEKRLGGITVLAMTKLEVLRSPDRRARNRSAAYALIVLFVAATIGLLAYLQSSVP
jgi:hypothetical protein